MENKPLTQIERINRYNELIKKQTGNLVRPFREDGYVNMLNKYGTAKDTTEHYHFEAEPQVPDDQLASYYEGNGLFAKIIDTPAEEAVKHGFTLKDVKDEEIESFYTEALDELDWDETAMSALKWTRLFGGAIIVMLINDGRGIDEPLDWANIKSIDDLRVYDRSLIQPDYSSMFSYKFEDPFRTRGSRLGMPEYYDVFSRYGNFRVHESRALVFQNGVLPEKVTNSVYQMWGIPEYIRINRAIRDAEVAHGSVTKLLDRSIQAVYKMKGLASELATEEGEERVLRRLQTIDMARGLLNSITIDGEGEEYDFRQFTYSGVADVIDSTCNFLSALTSIPQTILFGRSPAGMNSTGTSDLENYYNYVERYQKRALKKNLRYLLAVLFQAGVNAGDVDEVPKIQVEFNPLWSLSDIEKANLDQTKAAIQLTKAQTAVTYIQAEVVDPSEVRRSLADSEEFDIDTMLDEMDDETLFPEGQPEFGEGGQEQEGMQMGGMGPMGGMEAQMEDPAMPKPEDPTGKDVEAQMSGKAPSSAPTATKLPQDMTAKEKAEVTNNVDNPEDIPKHKPEERPEEAKPKKNTDAEPIVNPLKRSKIIGGPKQTSEFDGGSVGVLVVKDGKLLVGTRHNTSHYGLICGAGGHIDAGENAVEAARRETEEEFGIKPIDLIPIGRGRKEKDTGLKPYLFLCTEYEGTPACNDTEMVNPQFCTIEQIYGFGERRLFKPFLTGVKVLEQFLQGQQSNFRA